MVGSKECKLWILFLSLSLATLINEFKINRTSLWMIIKCNGFFVLSFFQKSFRILFMFDTCNRVLMDSLAEVFIFYCRPLIFVSMWQPQGKKNVTCMYLMRYLLLYFPINLTCIGCISTVVPCSC